MEEIKSHETIRQLWLDVKKAILTYFGNQNHSESQTKENVCC